MGLTCINGACECTGCMVCQDNEKNIRYCDDCNGEIYDGDDYYEVDDHVICSDCINNYWRVSV